MLLSKSAHGHDVEVAADVAYVSGQPFAASGIAFRMSDRMTGYLAGYREIEKGPDWERPVVQLYRLDGDGWKLLQEAKILNGHSGVMRRLKVICRGPSIWVFDEDMYTPVIAEHDDTYHSYANAGGKLPGADGGPEHLCTETLNRPHATLIDCVDKIGGKNNGFVAWELMIGRDNCRFPWVTPTAWTNPPNPSMAWSTPTVIRGM